MSDLSFEAPWRLLLLLAVAAVALAYVLVQRRRTAYAVRFADVDLLESVAPRSPRWRRHLPAALLVTALAFMVTAFAKPAAAVEVPSEAATIVVAIDTSVSMQATDVEPSRFAAAQEAAVQFVEGLPDGIDVGLVSFSGSASLEVAPTDDRDAVVSAIEDLQLGQGTAIGEAVAASVAAAGETALAEGEEPTPTSVVLLSDGSNTQGRSIEESIQIATRADIPVSTIAYGTADAAVSVQGQRVSVPVDTAALETLATDTGGEAYTAESSSELQDVYADIGDQVGTTTEREDVSSAFAGMALLVTLGAAGGSLAWSPRLP
ncbi:VWA domain-containing protein [Blastococcus sp. TF02-9]|uniref:VWA domain-containing protein n=1 Tax=Blastococcus sp. TF02-09 TaxID=2250576 RepID=UPI001F17C789|nr:VWA domain-containing protein [Blastococcus sp. TF02-9]